MKHRELPQWAVDMNEKEWKKLGQEHKGYVNCSDCGSRLILTLCSHEEDKFYCMEHCPEHKWQTDYDWGNECARCGINYYRYLELLLEKNGIEYSAFSVSEEE